MAPARRTLHLEVSDIIEPEQEDAVIRALAALGRSGEELRERFRTTDTCTVKNLSPEQARALAEELRAHRLEVRTIDPRKQESTPDQESVRCPRCGHLLEFVDWRCPECYYEFEDYRFDDDQEAPGTRPG
ncbi:MAG: hypothetical protein ACOC8N_05040 [Spirochaetota bacterium]